MEKKIIRGISGEPFFIEGAWADEEIRPGEQVVMAHAISPETRKIRGKASRGESARKKTK